MYNLSYNHVVVLMYMLLIFVCFIFLAIVLQDMNRVKRKPILKIKKMYAAAAA
jgi:hypothetical protein